MSDTPPLRVALLDPALDRKAFRSGVEPLDRYFLTQLTQDIRRRVASCFVALTDESDIAGFYTLSSTSALLNDVLLAIHKKLPRYPTVPAVRIGRLAVDERFRGQGLGGALLADALDCAARAEIAAFAMVVDTKDGKAAAFYTHHGFIAFPDTPLKLLLPLATVRG